jgi:hypothetical protein
MGIIFNFIYKYFFDSLIVLAFAGFSKVLINYFGNDRAIKIKETVLLAMLWAEEQFGIGTGEQKWTAAWNKIVELLQKQGIKLKNKEISFVTDLMKSNIPDINSMVYNTLPEKSKETRELRLRTPETIALVNELRKKYPNEEK